VDLELSRRKRKEQRVKKEEEGANSRILLSGKRSQKK
jgi:hypothetical protein